MRSTHASGRPSVPPERLLKALLLQILFSIRSERLLVESLDYNLLYRWFVGLGIDDRLWDHSTFSQNRDRLFNEGLARIFFERVKRLAQWGRFTSGEHFSVDGTLIEAWASHKSFKPKDGGGPPSGPGRNREVDFKGQRRINDTHASSTDPDAQLFRKSQGAEARLAHMSHILMENRNGLVVDVDTTPANGTAEREAALRMIRRQCRYGVPAFPAKIVDIAADNPGRAVSFIRELRAQGQRIAPNPPGYRLRPELGDDIRSCAHRNYVVFFAATPEELTIIRLLHGARDIPAILAPDDSGQ